MTLRHRETAPPADSARGAVGVFHLHTLEHRVYLRLERQADAGWTLAHGPDQIGHIHHDRITFVGFPDPDVTRTAADAASEALGHWHDRRSSTIDAAPGPRPAVALTDDQRGFTFPRPADVWHAVALEVAQRVHTATAPFRHPEQEPAT